MDMCLPKFDRYRSAVAPNCSKSHTNSWCSDFFKKKKKAFCLMSGLIFTLSDVTSFLPETLSGLKKYIFRLGIVRIIQGVQCKNSKVYHSSMGIYNNNTE